MAATVSVRSILLALGAASAALGLFFGVPAHATARPTLTVATSFPAAGSSVGPTTRVVVSWRLRRPGTYSVRNVALRIYSGNRVVHSSTVRGRGAATVQLVSGLSYRVKILAAVSCSKPHCKPVVVKASRRVVLAASKPQANSTLPQTSSTVPPTSSSPSTPTTDDPADDHSTDDCELAPASGTAEQLGLSAIWANSGEDKVTRDETRASGGSDVRNALWDGSKIKLFAARNEVVNFNLILEALHGATSEISVKFDQLVGPGCSTIDGKPASKTSLYDWTDRDIELFYTRYLKIEGLSRLSYESYYDERHVPEKMRRPLTDESGGAEGDWFSRPNHDKYYPDIAVPLELEQGFSVAGHSNQSIWSDIYVPKSAAVGTYRGNVTVQRETDSVRVPVELTVGGLTLPDKPHAKSMLFVSPGNMIKRYLDASGTEPATGSVEERRFKQIQNEHYQLAHRHKLTLIDSYNESQYAPKPIWNDRFSGDLYTSANGYRGPGAGVGNDLYSIGSYGSWAYNFVNELDNRGQITSAQLTNYADRWQQWFQDHYPDVDHFLYLIDEPNSHQWEWARQWSEWVANGSGVGRALKTFATVWLDGVVNGFWTDEDGDPSTGDGGKESYLNPMPDLDIAASGFAVGNPDTWQPAADSWRAQGREHYVYNGRRPSHGSFAIEDEGVSPREIPWAQTKMGVDRWFFWESTYYNDYQSGSGQTDVFNRAKTFGSYASDCYSASDCGGGNWAVGKTGWAYGNGDGVLFYPGTDKLFPDSSYGVDGPIASLRLKYWRRGVQDMDYYWLAAQKNRAAADAVISSVVDKTLWDIGVDSPIDPTYRHTDIGWSTDPDAWENARRQLALIAGR